MAEEFDDVERDDRDIMIERLQAELVALKTEVDCRIAVDEIAAALGVSEWPPGQVTRKVKAYMASAQRMRTVMEDCVRFFQGVLLTEECPDDEREDIAEWMEQAKAVVKVPYTNTAVRYVCEHCNTPHTFHVDGMWTRGDTDD